MTVEAERILEEVKCNTLSDKELNRSIALLLGAQITSQEECCASTNSSLSDIAQAIEDGNEKLDTVASKLDEIIALMS